MYVHTNKFEIYAYIYLVIYIYIFIYIIFIDLSVASAEIYMLTDLQYTENSNLKRFDQMELPADLLDYFFFEVDKQHQSISALAKWGVALLTRRRGRCFLKSQIHRKEPHPGGGLSFDIFLV